MAVLSETWSGLRLAPLPKPTDQFKKDKIAQAVVVELPRDKTDKLFKLIKDGDGFEATARLNDNNPSIEFSSKLSDSKSTTKEELSGKVLEKLLRLTDNGYIYMAGEISGQASMRSRLELKRPPSKKLDGEEDAGLLALQRGLKNAKAEKQSHRTTLAEVRPSAKRHGASLMASLTGGTNNPKAHRVGLFGGNKPLPRSVNASPSLGPQSLGTSSRPRKDSKKDAAKKRAIVHLLAVRPVSASYISKTINANLKEVEPILARVASPYRLDTSKYELNDLAYKLLDPHGFDYSEDDRSRAIERAVAAFDRKRFASDNKAWQMLLVKEERNKGKCLSKLPNLLATDQPKPLEGTRTTPVPEINVSEAGSPARSTNGKQGEASDTLRKRSSSDAANNDSPDRAVKRPKKGPDSHEKVLSAMFNQTQKEKERAKERAKAEKEAQNLAKKRESKTSATTQPPSVKAGKAMTSSRPSGGTTSSSTAPSTGKIKSAEFVSKSDDEEAEAAVQKAKEKLAAKSVKTAAKPTAKTAAKTTTNPTTGTASSAKVAVKVASEAVDKTVKKPNTVATTSNNTTQKSAKPSAWDFSKKPASSSSAPTSSLSSSSANSRPRASSSTKSTSGPLPSASSTAGLHRRQISDTRRVGATPTAAKGATKAPAQPTSTGGSTTQNAVSGRPLPKPASARPNFIRALDSAKRKPGVDSKASKPSNSYAGTGANATKKETSGGMERGSAPTASRAVGTNAPARVPDAASAPPMHRTISHQRKSSSPLKQSPLAASPPINLSDIESARQNKTTAAKTLPKKPLPSFDAKGSSQPLKRKTEDLEERHGQGRPSTASSGSERPVKRRELGTAISNSTGATGSKVTTTATRLSDTAVSKPRRRSQEEGNRSHSPSPASSTIGSTSTKDTAISLLGSASKDKAAASSRPPTAQSASTVKSEGTFKGIKTSELERMSRFEEQREHYNRKQREVAGMDNPPIEKVRELNKLFDSLQTQKKVLAALEHSH